MTDCDHFDYRRLIRESSEIINRKELPKLVFDCKDYIPKGSEDSITDVPTLFRELENQNNLGIDNLHLLIKILTSLKKEKKGLQALLVKVKDFQTKRNARSVGVISSLKWAAGKVKGGVRLVCNYQTLAGGALLVGCGLALYSCTTFEEYRDAFDKVILPALTKFVELNERSSLCFTVQAETPSALNELWSIYKNGILKHRLQEFLVTEKIKQLASGEDIEVTVYVDEQEYRETYLDLMFQQNQASEKKRPSAHRRRRNSDSFLFVGPKEDELTLMKLEQAENKWNFKMQVLEKEIEKLETEVAKTEDLKRQMNERGGNDTTRDDQKEIKGEIGSISEKMEISMAPATEDEAVRPGHHPGTDEVYNMTARPRGIALIINNYIFDGHPEPDIQSIRHGSEKDVRQVKALFDALGFEVHPNENLTRLQLLNELDSVACQDHSGYDCFVLWLMSHGKSGVVLCSDGETLPIQSAQDMLSNCKTLSGKPKLFFIQVCRGDEEDEGFTIMGDALSPIQDPPDHVDPPSGEYNPSASRITPTHADFLYSYATVDGNVSYRHKALGSYYVRALVDVFHDRATDDDLLGILTTVNRKVSEMVMTMPALGRKSDVKSFKQMPEVKHTLLKRLRF